MALVPEMAKVAGNPGPTPTVRHFNCQDRPIDGSQGLKCYGPAQIQAAYGYSSLLASGIDGTGAIESASTPASDPAVTAVGGTTLNADGETGAYIGETTWTELPVIGCNPPALDLPFDVNCSGGGFSTVYPRPSWQASQVNDHARGLPDVAFSAGVNGGVLTVCSVCDGGPPAFFLFGGTSVGPPTWSG
jgi:subtilase family serine protease